MHAAGASANNSVGRSSPISVELAWVGQSRSPWSVGRLIEFVSGICFVVRDQLLIVSADQPNRPPPPPLSLSLVKRTPTATRRLQDCFLPLTERSPS